MASPDLPIRTFDPNDEFSTVERRNLPHRLQAGTLVFITWRTWDSLPKPVIAACRRARSEWLLKQGIDPSGDSWREGVLTLSRREQFEFRRLIAERWESALDDSHGECVLRQVELSTIVSDSLLHFDGLRYLLTDFVVMPNHVHVMAAFPTPEAMLAQCNSWKHFTAAQINRRLRRKGVFWEVDGFDHLVRSEDQFLHFRRYIADNPTRAKLMAGEFQHYSKQIEPN